MSRRVQAAETTRATFIQIQTLFSALLAMTSRMRGSRLIWDNFSHARYWPYKYEYASNIAVKSRTLLSLAFYVLLMKNVLGQVSNSQSAHTYYL